MRFTCGVASACALCHEQCPRRPSARCARRAAQRVMVHQRLPRHVVRDNRSHSCGGCGSQRGIVARREAFVRGAPRAAAPSSPRRPALQTRWSRRHGGSLRGQPNGLRRPSPMCGQSARTDFPSRQDAAYCPRLRMTHPSPVCALCGDVLDVPDQHLQAPADAEMAACPFEGCGSPMHEICRRPNGTKVARCAKGHRHRKIRMSVRPAASG